MADDPRPSRLQVILAGHNGDVEVLLSGVGEFTPETISAAYARISRSPDPVPELRRQAREEVERARRSNRTIVFGLGHHSVAEHAVLNFDILGCSRLAIEALEWHRLCSYTEKSQRYITLDGDFVLPRELNDPERESLSRLVAAQNRTYELLLPLLLRRQEELQPEMTERKRDRTLLAGLAKEDARYIVSLATEGQLGFSCNARNLELVVRRLRWARLDEVRRLGTLLFEQARQIVPSLIILADEDGFRETYGAALRDRYFKQAAEDLLDGAAAVECPDTDEPQAAPHCRGQVTLVDHPPDPDAAVISALLFAAGSGPLDSCLRTARSMAGAQRLIFVRQVLSSLSEYDAPPRAFEEASFRFELVVDASAMAQLKRHRMTTQHWGPYDPELGVTVPPQIDDVGEGATFAAMADRTAEAYHALRASLAGRGAPVEPADYALTNAHRRRVALTMNLRELYHFSRLREDRHAQWAIREVASDLSALVREVAPITAMLVGGKDRFSDIYRSAMGCEPPS